MLHEYIIIYYHIYCFEKINKTELKSILQVKSIISLWSTDKSPVLHGQ